jgi:hypothetical protein
MNSESEHDDIMNIQLEDYVSRKPILFYDSDRGETFNYYDWDNESTGTQPRPLYNGNYDSDEEGDETCAKLREKVNNLRRQ